MLELCLGALELCLRDHGLGALHELDGQPVELDGAPAGIGVDGDVIIAYKDLTADTVIGWVKDHFGTEKVTEIEQAMFDQLEQQRAPKTATGVPW